MKTAKTSVGRARKTPAAHVERRRPKALVKAPNQFGDRAANSLGPFCAIGIDVGGTKISAAIVTFPKAEVREKRKIPTHPTRGGEAVLADVLSLCTELTNEARRLGRQVQAIGVGLCELIDLEGNVASENCIAWRNASVLESLSNSAAAILEADVRAAALAEALFGAGKPFGQFLYVTVGTGISCCLMLEGKPFVGSHGATGTMASSPLSVVCEDCGKVARQTLEEIASGPALVARYNALRVGAAATGEAVVSAAIAGDPDALRVVRSGGEALGAAVGWLANVLDPEAIVVGGGLGLSEGPFWENFVVSTRKHIWWESGRSLPILRAATGPDAGLIGAAAAAWQRFGASTFSNLRGR